MSPADIIPIPGHPDMHARRVIVEAWQAAGSPPINSALRLYAAQKEAWNKYRNGTGAPADDPDRPHLFPLAHVRGVALDIDATRSRVAALTAAGLVRPFSYEPWHWTVRNVYAYPLVTAIPAAAAIDATPLATPQPPAPVHWKDDTMRIFGETNGSLFLAKPGGIVGIKNQRDLGILRRLLDSDPAKPDTFNAAERDIIAWYMSA